MKQTARGHVVHLTRHVGKVFVMHNFVVIWFLRRKNTAKGVCKTGRFEDIDSAVIISSAFLHVLLIMTAEFMLSKRPVLRIIVALLFFFKLFSSYIYCVSLSLYFFLV